MAYTTINKSTDYFNTKLYTGTVGSSNSQTGGRISTRLALDKKKKCN